MEINTSFAKLINNDEFEIIYNINANNKIFFGELNILFPDDINKDNYKEIFDLFDDLKGKTYSINDVEKILNEIDIITTNEEFKSIKSTVDEEIISNKLNINFTIEDTEKILWNKLISLAIT